MQAGSYKLAVFYNSATDSKSGFEGGQLPGDA